MTKSVADLPVETLAAAGVERIYGVSGDSLNGISMPPTITAEQVKGFSLFMLKAVLSGRGSELVDLAKINLFR